jgi:hypothetical protein
MRRVRRMEGIAWRKHSLTHGKKNAAVFQLRLGGGGVFLCERAFSLVTGPQQADRHFFRSWIRMAWVLNLCRSYARSCGNVVEPGPVDHASASIQTNRTKRVPTNSCETQQGRASEQNGCPPVPRPYHLERDRVCVPAPGPVGGCLTMESPRFGGPFAVRLSGGSVRDLIYSVRVLICDEHVKEIQSVFAKARSVRTSIDHLFFRDGRLRPETTDGGLDSHFSVDIVSTLPLLSVCPTSIFARPSACF